MANYLLKLGAYTFPDTFYVEKWPTTRNVPSAKLPRADGARVIAGYLEGKTWGLKGGLVGGSEMLPTAPTYLRPQLDALRAACAGGMQNFQTHDDRYFRNCQVSMFEENYTDVAFARFAEISLEIVSGDPFGYDVAGQTGGGTIIATGQTKTVTAGGNVSSLPSLSLTIGSGTAAAITLTNTTTGEACTLTGTVAAGDVYLIDSLNKTVTKSGVNSISLFDGLFPRLSVGLNTLRVDYTGAAVSNLGIVWNNRWL